MYPKNLCAIKAAIAVSLMLKKKFCNFQLNFDVFFQRQLTTTR